jgi:aminoglycoside phosphotransferase (APT) family kinase protein
VTERRARDAELIARSVLGTPIVTTERVPTGFGNENYRVTDARGRRVVVKIGPLSSAAKWSSSRVAHRLAASAGVPVPELVHFTEQDDRVVRVYDWVDGRSPNDVSADPDRVARFAADLGRAVATLHTIDVAAFGSRLDGSAPSFARWTDYLEHRLGQITARCREHDALEEVTLDRARVAIARLATDVGDAPRPTLCHRDLHADNLLVDDDGRLVAILDWDMAEAWDPAAEWFKLGWMLFPEVPGTATAFEAAYHSTHPEPPAWRERKRLVDLLETLNTIPNAMARAWSRSFEVRARTHLDELLAAP